MRVGILLSLCVASRFANAESVIATGADVQASPGGGTRSAILIGGQYTVFFLAGGSVVYATTPDGVTFSTPIAASDSPASLGFSVARKGNTLGLAWGHSDASGFTLRYREASISGATLTFGATTVVSSHATDMRGYLATLAYSSTGTPYITALEYGHSYVGPIGPGCGSSARYRPTHYYFQGGWQMRTYCNNFDTVRDPNSIAIAPAGQNMVIGSALDANMSMAIVNDSAELAEPWHMVPAIDHTSPGQLSVAQSLSTATDVHVLYRDGAGIVSYGRLDGTNLDLNAQLVDVSTLNSAARDPALSRPTSVAGCHVATYVVGNRIMRRTFSTSVASLAAEQVVYTRPATPAKLSAELDAQTAPALVWQEGNSVMFGFACGGDPVTLTVTPDTVAADGASMIDVTSTPFYDACGALLPAGSLITVTSSSGSIVDADASADYVGTQVKTDAAGRIALQLAAGTTGGPAIIAAMPVTGGTNANAQVMFTGEPIDSSCGDGFVDATAGEQCDSTGVDTPTCNASDCQPARCGDGYVNVAAAEDCEGGDLCDMTTCTYAFILGGGCGGCRTPADPPLWLALGVGIALIRRRRPRSAEAAAGR
jgi:MYXO-CTERM domain-containing protein